MNTEQIRDLAIKILGLYFMAHAIIMIPQILGTLAFAGNSEYVTNQSLFVLASSFPIAFYALVAYVLLRKSRAVLSWLWPAPEQEAEPARSATPALATWVGLIGLFYLIGSLAGVLAHLYILAVKRELMGSYLSFEFLPDLITAVLAAICVLKARKIAEYLKTKTAASPHKAPDAAGGDADA